MDKTLGTEKHNKLIWLLIEARESKSIPQTELAEELDVYQSLIARIESGERRLDVIEFIEVSKALNLDPLKLIRELQ